MSMNRFAKRRRFAPSPSSKPGSRTPGRPNPNPRNRSRRRSPPRQRRPRQRSKSVHRSPQARRPRRPNLQGSRQRRRWPKLLLAQRPPRRRRRSRHARGNGWARRAAPTLPVTSARPGATRPVRTRPAQPLQVLAIVAHVLPPPAMRRDLLVIGRWVIGRKARGRPARAMAIGRERAAQAMAPAAPETARPWATGRPKAATVIDPVRKAPPLLGQAMAIGRVMAALARVRPA